MNPERQAARLALAKLLEKIPEEEFQKPETRLHIAEILQALRPPDELIPELPKATGYKTPFGLAFFPSDFLSYGVMWE